MPKRFKWFAIDHLGFIKLIGYFYKMPGYFIQGKTYLQKRNNRRKEKGKTQPTPQATGPLTSAWPSPTGHLVFFLPSLPSCSVASRGCADATEASLEPPLLSQGATQTPIFFSTLIPSP